MPVMNVLYLVTIKSVQFFFVTIQRVKPITGQLVQNYFAVLKIHQIVISGFKAGLVYEYFERLQEEVSYNGRSGTLIHLDTGESVTVEAWATDVSTKVNEAQKA